MIWPVLLLLPLAAACAGILYQRAGISRDKKRFPPPGRVTDAPGLRLHVQQAGTGRLAVIFESGIAASSLNWTRVHSQVAEFTKAVSYDRAGFGWSGSCNSARTSEQILSDLDVVVRTAGERCVMVGHSFGALIVRLYASRHRDRVAGLVLVDPALLGEWADPTPQRLRMLGRGVSLSRRGALLCRAGVVRFALAALSSGSRWLPKTVNRVSSGGGGASMIERLIGEVRKMPPELWPAIQSHWSRPECFESMGLHLAALPAVAAEVARTGSLGDLPLIVISGAHLAPAALEEHRAVAALSTRGKHLVARGGGHWVHLDEPDLVVSAVREVVDKASFPAR